MSVDTPSPRAAEAARDGVTSGGGRSVHVERARKLLAGGAVGGLVATALSLLGFGLGYGVRGLVSAALAAALVLFFYAVGQYVMVLFADAGARLLLSVALCSYTTRILLLGLCLLIYQRNAVAFSSVVPTVVFLTTVAVVVGWLVAEVWVFSRLRVTVFDAPYESPSEAGDAA